jgi:hypothetical protein
MYHQVFVNGQPNYTIDARSLRESRQQARGDLSMIAATIEFASKCSWALLIQLPVRTLKVAAYVSFGMFSVYAVTTPDTVDSAQNLMDGFKSIMPHILLISATCVFGKTCIERLMSGKWTSPVDEYVRCRIIRNLGLSETARIELSRELVSESPVFDRAPKIMPELEGQIFPLKKPRSLG